MTTIAECPSCGGKIFHTHRSPGDKQVCNCGSERLYCGDPTCANGKQVGDELNLFGDDFADQVSREVLKLTPDAVPPPSNENTYIEWTDQLGGPTGTSLAPLPKLKKEKPVVKMHFQQPTEPIGRMFPLKIIR